MCRLTKQLQQMSNDVQGDAILIQPRFCNAGRADYDKATAIIRRVHRPHGSEWVFNNLLTISDTPLADSGTIGDIERAVSNAKYQYGDKLFDKYDFIPVSYQDPSFPQHLIA